MSSERSTVLLIALLTWIVLVMVVNFDTACSLPVQLKEGIVYLDRTSFPVCKTFILSINKGFVFTKKIVLSMVRGYFLNGEVFSIHTPEPLLHTELNHAKFTFFGSTLVIRSFTTLTYPIFSYV